MTSTTLEYRDGDVRLKGVLVRDDERTDGPAVVLFPDARGVGAHAIECAGRLAALGYPTLVADLYGEGLQARDMAQAGELMRGLRADVDRWRARARAALDAVSRQDGVDRSRLAALGYCFGGGTALELARSGAPLAAVVSFHGVLASPRPADAANIKAKVLVCHGAADPLVPPAEVAAFEEEMGRTRSTGSSTPTVERCTPSPIRKQATQGSRHSPTTKRRTGDRGPPWSSLLQEAFA